MGTICYKFENEENPGLYYCITEGGLIIDNPNINGYCAEYDIVKKISENSEGYFNFSKSMIDIGSNYGCYTMLLDFKHAYCFEPNKKICALIHANTFLFDKVYTTDIYNIALSDVEGTLKFNGFCCEGCGSPDETREDIYEKMHEIPCQTLDSYGFKDIGFIKIDVEGFEEKVLSGGLKTLILNNYPPILFECWDVGYYNMTQEKHDRLFNLLNMLGYEILEYWGDFETHLAIHKNQINK